jgi:hypothetical protein
VVGDTAATDARARACGDVLNFISHATHLLYVYAPGTADAVAVDNVFSCDEFAVHLGKVKTKGSKVCTTKEATKHLTEQKKAMKNPKKSSGFQAKASMAKITISLTITPTGDITSAVFAIREDDYATNEGGPWTFKASSMEVTTLAITQTRPLDPNTLAPTTQTPHLALSPRTLACPRSG